jgi:hypothetical protein
MGAGIWVCLGVLFLLGACVFPPSILASLVCFVGMAVALTVKPPQKFAGINTPDGLVQKTTDAHWSSFERMTSEYGGIFRVLPPDGQANTLSDTLRVGEAIRVVPVRTQSERGTIIDTFKVFGGNDVFIGRLPQQIDAKYVDAMKTQGAAFDGRVHHITASGGQPVILAEFRRCDSAYLAKKRREAWWDSYGAGVTLAACVGIPAAIGFLLLYLDVI